LGLNKAALRHPDRHLVTARTEECAYAELSLLDELRFEER